MRVVKRPEEGAMLTRWNDFERSLNMLDSLRRQMDTLFSDYDRGALPTYQSTWPRVNLYDADSKVVLEAEVPGVSKADLDITVTADVLAISGRRTAEVPAGYSVHRRERGAVQFARSFALRDKVDPEKVSAELKDGVLTITLEKAPEAQPRKITLKA
jgi:HSP20 family protein